ncbi:hypothetical protein ABWL39_18915 [Chitinivorax sp. PXF-14]|uniref:FFLEELY motif protein n=1 Tax=Chitinivorax sp. PXF-14 TaxID=3230488 RepID=UPI003466B245
MSDTSNNLPPQRHALADWQSRRLRQTYADLLADPRYHDAATYFLSDLYGPHDFSLRDQQAERVHAKLQRLLPKHLVAPMTNALELNTLSQSLDQRLCEELFDVMQVDSIDDGNYCEAYRRCDNHAERQHQIELMALIGHDLERVVTKPLVSSLLTLSRVPAQLAGLMELHQSLERGFHAFRSIGGASHFIDTVVEREQAILDRIYAKHPDPLTL